MKNIASKSDTIVITRKFKAPVELVWKAWTDPETFKKWWGPKSFSCPYCEINLSEGGTYLNCMRSQQGENYWGMGTYKEITPQKKLVFTDSFADENANVVPASHYGMDEDFPLEMLVTVTFEEINSKTRMTLRHVGIPKGEIQKATKTGWNQSFDKLAKLVETSVRKSKY